MTIKCFFGDYSSHKSELKMLNNFLSQLAPVYNGTDRWIYVIYNAMWSGQEVDLVCITQNSIIVADFKNYSGRLKGQENGEWEMNTFANERIAVKGGGQINPFVQIRKNKYAVMEWLRSNNLLLNENTGHTAGLVIFSELESADIRLSYGVQQWFYTTDIPHVDDSLLRIRSQQINISEVEADEIVQKLNLQPYQWTAQEPITPRFNPYPELKRQEIAKTVNYSRLANKGLVESKKPPEADISAFKHIYRPFLIMLLICFTLSMTFVYSAKHDGVFFNKVVGGVIGKSNLNQLKKLSSFMTFSVDSLDDPEYENIPDLTVVPKGENITIPQQLINEKEGTIYGFKIGKDTKEYVKSQLILGELSLKKLKEHPDVFIQYPWRSTFGLEAQAEDLKLHKKLPGIDMPDIFEIIVRFKDEKVSSLIFHTRSSHLPAWWLHYQVKRFKQIGYEELNSHYEQKVGDQYAILAKGESYIVLKDYHMQRPSITFTTKEMYEAQKPSKDGEIQIAF